MSIHTIAKWASVLLVASGGGVLLELMGVQQVWLIVLMSVALALCVGITFETLSRGRGDRATKRTKLPESRWRLEGSTVGEWELDCETNEVLCSKILCTMLGLDAAKSSFSKDEFCRSVLNEDRESFESTLAAVLRFGATHSVDCRVGEEPRTQRWTEVIMSPLLLRSTVIKVSGIFIDISDRKYAEAQLLAERASLGAIVENTDDVVISLDNDLCITALNTRFKVLMKASYGAKTDLGDYLFAYTSKELESLWLPRYQKALDGDEVRVEDTFYVRGKPFNFDVSLKPIRNNGIVQGVAVYSRHITEQKKREAEWVAAKEKAEESDQLKSAFLANMSHEIRTPLNAIMGFAQLLKEESLTPEERSRFLEIVLSNGSHLLRILGDIMDLAQIESNQLRIENERFDLGLLLDETQALFADQVAVSSQGKVTLKLNNQLGENYVVTSDQTRLKQIVFNLISNALKFTEEGSVTLSCQRIDRGLIELSVADTGSGVSDESKHVIFERFSRGMDSMSTRKEGVGLGLSICKGIARLLGGHIWVEDNKPKGTVFKFTIRDGGSVLSQVNDSAEALVREAEGEGDGLTIRGCVLVAENDDTNFVVINEFLKHYSLECVRVFNGKEAVQFVRKDPYRAGLVLMDLSMPVMNGFDATREIKRIQPDLPVVAHTAHAMERDLEFAREAGCSHCLVKPVSLERLGEVLRQVSRAN